MPNLRTNGAIPLFPLYVFIACTVITSPFKEEILFAPVCLSTRHEVSKTTYFMFLLFSLCFHFSAIPCRNKLLYSAFILLKSSDRYKTYYITQNRANEVAFHVRIRLRCGWCSLSARTNARLSKTDWTPVALLDFITHEIIIITEYEMNFDFIRVFGALLMSDKINFWNGCDNTKPQDVWSENFLNTASRKHSAI